MTITAAPAAPVGGVGYRLVTGPPPTVRAPVLDEHQRAVVDHPGGPLLVLAGPGTGKTTTLVEAVVARVERGLTPDQVLVLTFSRKAAAELRDRITTRLGRTSATPLAGTFHSFCYALLRSYQPADLYEHPLRLLSGPEQELAVRELLAGGVEEGIAVWPEELRAALATRGFAEEVRAVIARVRELGLDPFELGSVAKAVDRPDWQAAAQFLDEYLDVLDTRGVIDYAELVHRAVLLAEQPDVRAELRDRYRAVFVDEYQDTDAAQVRLLRALAGQGRDLTVVGDPDQSIYAFRGADVTGILGFRGEFPQPDGAPAPVRVLATSRRAGPGLLAASRELTRRMPLSRLPAEDVRAHRDLTAGPGRYGDGRVEVRTFPTLGAELAGIAELLRRAHLEQGVPWSQMAVLVRSGVRSIPWLRRALGAAGVPVEVAGDDLPLHREPAVVPLLTALRCAADPAELTAEIARVLLLSPLGGADAGDLRRLGRALRAEELQAGGQRPGTGFARPAAEVIREAVADPRLLTAFDDRVAGPARRLGRLLADARTVLTGGGTAEEALWRIWDGTPWPRRLERTAYRGGAGGRAADRDLDAVCALFEAAGRTEGWGEHGVRNFLAELEAQEIPGSPLAERAVRGEAVRLLTAHRSKGLEWRLVVVTAVQEGLWPDLRRRGSVLEADRIGPDGLTSPLSTGAILAEERRLFYVAVTRASERLVVTAVRSPQDDGEQPSRFLDELGVEPVDVTERPRRPLSPAGLVAELRATMADPASSEPLRRAAAVRLAALARESDPDGYPLVPAADPRRWWGLAETTDPQVPVRDPAAPVRLSGSAVSALASCPLRWFLGREAHAAAPPSGELGFGRIVHVLADDVAQGRTPPELDALTERLERVWNQLAFEARWRADQQMEEARSALGRFLNWHLADRDREPVATEHSFSVTLAAGGHDVTVTGSMDRVERDSDGRAHVVDFKTGKAKASGEELRTHPQLGVYQLAVSAGALDELPAFGSDRPAAGGAELVQLRHENGGLPVVQSQAALTPDEDGSTWVGRLVGDLAGRVLAEDFTPATNAGCDRCEFRVCCPAWPQGRQVVE